MTNGFDALLEDLSNWYIRRSRRRFYSFDEAAFRTLWTALVQALRVMSPVLPFLSERLWQELVADVVEGAPASVHLAGWPQRTDRPDDAHLLTEVAAVRDVVALGRRARNETNLKLRQPLRSLYVRGAPAARAHADEIADELRVKEVRFDEGPTVAAQLLPNLRLLGPRLGKKLPEVRAALRQGEFETLDGGRLRVAGELLERDEVHPRRAHPYRGLGDRRGRRDQRRVRHYSSTTTCAAKAACSTSSTRSTRCARTRGST